MRPIETIGYRSAGGESERRSYKGGEGLTIESQDEGYVLAWSADAQAGDFLRVIGELVGLSADTELLPRTNGRRLIPLGEAAVAVASHPEVKVVEVTADDETFVWTARDPYAKQRKRLNRVAVAFSALNRGLLTQLIADTAASQVKSDLDGIIESAERLTHSSLSASA